MGNEVILVCKDIVKKFGPVNALNGVDFEVRRGLSGVCVRRIISRCCCVFRKIIWRQFGRTDRGMIA